MSRIFSLRTVLISFVCIHALLFLYDLSNPDAFLTGDRAHGRLNNVNLFLESLENSSTTTNSLTESGTMFFSTFENSKAILPIMYSLFDSSPLNRKNRPLGI